MPDTDLPKGTGWHLLPLSKRGDPVSSTGWRPFWTASSVLVWWTGH